MKSTVYLSVLLFGLCAAAAQAATYNAQSYNGQPSAYQQPAAQNAAALPSNKTPDYIAAGFGAYDFDKNGDRGAVDYRLEYQSGLSLLPLISRNLAGYDSLFQLHPEAGLEGDGNGMSYFHGGLNFDVRLPYHFVFTWGEAVGLYNHGDDRQSLGSPLEFRSQLELGYTLDNNMRLSGYISHLSNAGVGDHNPGAEVIGGYLRIPVSWLAH